ncbi:hypothetical protein [Pontibacter ruber]|uniref:DegT/DnrJ/EryC1/StrS aminotransferase family protein n=1 Tax=Pontibacter ruber TaxID=1343895 RepID=A0ABW5CSD2_9BACT|nr:hypothetical protein [Pontibacter ruber]
MSLSEAIGGYLGLHINPGKAYYSDLVELNTGRNAFEYILLARKYKKVYIPYFTCDAVLEPIHKHNIEYSFYRIDSRLEPVDVPILEQHEAFLYTNYFGLKTQFISSSSHRICNLIIDNAQAFFSRPLVGVDTFYSPRKFFGLPDGGYASTTALLHQAFPQDISAGRCSHLLLRLDTEPEIGFESYKNNENDLADKPIMQMSKLTKSILNGITYDWALERRNNNFAFLHNILRNYNKFQWLDEIHIEGPLVYPFYTDNDKLRDWLATKKIYTATYWPNVFKTAGKNTLEYALASNVVYLPVDQRYNEESMTHIINHILYYYGIQNKI